MEQEVPVLTVCPGAPGACLAKVPQMRVTMMITLIHIHDYIYAYTVAIKNSRSASKCDEKQKQKQTNNRQQRDKATETLTLTRLSLAQGAQPFDPVRTSPLLLSFCLGPNLANHLEEPINGPLIASLCLGSREWSQLMLMLTNKTELSQRTPLPSHLPIGLVPSLHMPRKLCQGSRKNILN